MTGEATALEKARRRLGRCRLFVTLFFPVYFGALAVTVAMFGPYVRFPAAYDRLFSLLLILGAAIGPACWVLLNVRFRYGYFRCPNCAQPFIDPRVPNAPIPKTCWSCGFDISTPV